jgi:hypothetical protein
MLTKIVREARKSNKAYGKNDLIKLLQERVQVDEQIIQRVETLKAEKFSLRKASYTVLPKTVHQSSQGL